MSEQIRLHAENLRLREREDVAASDELELALKPGTVCVLIGPSESERSGWLQVLAALRPPAAGRLRLLEYDSERPDRERRRTMQRQTSYIGAHAPLLSTFDVRSNVMLPDLYHRNATPADAARHADDLLDAVGYRGSRTEPPVHLDVFERRQALLARALALDPAVLFIDEPFELSTATRWDEIEQQLAAVAHENRVVVVATQNLRFAARYADLIVFIDQGSVAVHESWKSFASATGPAHTYLDAVPFRMEAIE